jgi:hypothetical protein
VRDEGADLNKAGLSEGEGEGEGEGESPRDRSDRSGSFGRNPRALELQWGRIQPL